MTEAEKAEFYMALGRAQAHDEILPAFAAVVKAAGGRVEVPLNVMREADRLTVVRVAPSVTQDVIVYEVRD